MNYEVLVGKKGQKQVRFWSHPKVKPVNWKQVKEILRREFPEVKEGEEDQLWFIPGFVNFWVERKTDGTTDTES